MAASRSAFSLFFRLCKASQIKELALKMPVPSRMKLAGELLRSTAPACSPDEALAEDSRREEEISSGKVKPLREEEFWRGVSKR
jgi:hypothetical protein